MKNICEICGCFENLTKHHLIPQVKNKYALKKKLQNQNIDIEKTINICSLCHTTIHALFTENELRDIYNNIDLLLSNEKFNNYVNWRKKHLNFSSNSTKMSNNKK